MAKLGKISNIKIGTIKVESTEGGERLQLVEAEVKLAKEVLPYDMNTFTLNGLETQLAARSLLWSSQNIGAVVKDRDGLYHGIETNIPRFELGDEFSFTEHKLPKSSHIDFVEFVTIPKVILGGSRQPANSSNPCFIDTNFNSRRAKTAAGQKLERKMKDAISKWEKWWDTFVANRMNPPSPPDDISQPFVEITGNLLNIQPSEIGVLKKPDESFSDQVSLDLFNNKASGSAGSLKSDLVENLASIKKGGLNVVLKLHADSFRGSAPALDFLETAIHEGTHYRHYVLTRQLIAMWQKTSKRSKRKKSTTEIDLRGEFARFVDLLVKKKQLSRIERQIVYSTFGETQATHPFAQLQAFMGAHILYPRELDMAASKKGRGVLDQPRFFQLRAGAVDWVSVQHPDVGSLSVQVIAEYAKQHQEKCVETDLRELITEIEKAAALKRFSPGAAKYFKELLAELNK